MRALLVVALSLQPGIQWDARSDLLVARLLGLLFAAELRAHPDSVYSYADGGWRRIQAITGSVLQKLEAALTRSRSCFISLLQGPVARTGSPRSHILQCKIWNPPPRWTSMNCRAGAAHRVKPSGQPISASLLANS